MACLGVADGCGNHDKAPLLTVKWFKPACLLFSLLLIVVAFSTCAGWGNRGALGNGGEVDSAVPVPVSGGHLFAPGSLGCGQEYTCALNNSGTLWCWVSICPGRQAVLATPGWQTATARGPANANCLAN